MFGLFKKKQLEIGSPVNGEVINLTKVSDPVFSQKMMGDGFAIKPSDGKIISPIQGIVQSIFPTAHALTIRGDSGVELLLHIGLDTVELNGEGFTMMVKEGERIASGDQLVNVDLHVLQAKGKDNTVLVVFPDMSAKQIIVSEGVAEKGMTVAVIK